MIKQIKNLDSYQGFLKYYSQIYNIINVKNKIVNKSQPIFIGICSGLELTFKVFARLKKANIKNTKIKMVFNAGGISRNNVLIIVLKKSHKSKNILTPYKLYILIISFKLNKVKYIINN